MPETSVLVAIERRLGNRSLLLTDLPSDAVLSAIALAELLVGLELADEAHRLSRSRFIEAVVDYTTVLPFRTEEAKVFARLNAHLRRAGTPIGDRTTS
jgi:tRNA(fMet)-specific endonuclease VapC